MEYQPKSISQIINLSAQMISPKKQQLINQNLYELPSCTICLSELTQEIVSLACGHCFHYICIQQHFEYKGTCPNCQKRAGSKQMRSIHFPVVLNSKANAHLRQLLSSVNVSQRKQVEELLKQIKEQSQKVDKLRNNMEQNEKEVVKRGETIKRLSDQKTALSLEVLNLRNENKVLQSEKDRLHKHLMSAEKHEAYLSSQLQKYEKQEKSYQQFKKFKRLMNENSQEIVNYKKQLESKETEPELMASLFFDMLMMKNLDCLRNKQKTEQYRETSKQNQIQSRKMKQQIEQLKKGMREASDQKLSERRKYEQLKTKYRALLDKAKLKGVQDLPPDMEDSNGIFNIRSQPSQRQPLNASMSQTQMTIEQQLPNGSTPAFKKPSFFGGGGSTFGGFRKKDDKIKTSL